jgi:hypothetical protein
MREEDAYLEGLNKRRYTSHLLTSKRKWEEDVLSSDNEEDEKEAGDEVGNCLLLVM